MRIGRRRKGRGKKMEEEREGGRKGREGEGREGVKRTNNGKEKIEEIRMNVNVTESLN